MSKERFCPECGAKIAENERFCPDCGSDIATETETARQPELPVQPERRESPVRQEPTQQEQQDGRVIGIGPRANISGGISTTTNSMSTSTSTRTSNTSVNTSNVDNSSTVNHNTTIVMGKDKAEYCEVCGNPFGEKHARCPKCGKQICFDCKVKNKNRCIECEKKAINEYRVAFQQLLLTTNGNIGIAGRQMMDSKARELDVEDVKAGIEKELTDLYKPATKPVQPTVAPASHAQTAPAQQAHAEEPHVFQYKPQANNQNSQSQNSQGQNNQNGQKGVGTLTGEAPLPPRTGNTGGNKYAPEKKKNKWLLPAIIAVIIIVVAVVVLKPKGEKKQADTAPAKTEQTQPATSQTSTPQAAEKVTGGSAPAQSVQKVQTAKKPAAEQATPKKDADYEAGMAAYEKGEGLEAIEHFTSSGSADSYYMLGVIYEQGCGSVGKNALKARQNFKKAADLGSAKAKAKL